MRVVFLSALAFAVASGLAFGATAAEPKKPKPVDIKKEMIEKCGAEPYGLVDLEGKTASKEEMEEAKFQVTAFITQVDVYQECILKLATALGDRTTENDKRILGAAITRSQEEKEAVGTAYNKAVDDFNVANKKSK
ncbi:MAG: hypothetical protein SGI91_13515 [Alphaproteobacteria bacterium]|jgi:hypothetical protein|nr:hypothetical protein [Alphaproteobacteria bacterium]